MMSTRWLVPIALVFAATIFLAACGSQSATTTADLDSAVQTAIAQTRVVENTVAAFTRRPPGVGQTPTEKPATGTPAAPAATDTPVPAAPTATDTPPPPSPTRVRVQIAESQVDGDDGNDFVRGSSTANQGRVILLPGFEQSDVTEPMVFRDRLVFQVEVFDGRVGLYDGAGIEHVTFRIEPDDGSGQLVYEKKEQRAGYCVFGGGEPDCWVLVFSENGNRWPEPFGTEIFNGQYVARIDIIPEDGKATQWRWRFEIKNPVGQLYPSPAPTSSH